MWSGTRAEVATNVDAVSERLANGVSEAEQAERESRVEAPLAVLFAVVLQVALAGLSLIRGWRMWNLPGWVWLIAVLPELVLILALSLPRSRRRLEVKDRRQAVSLALVIVIGLANLFSLVVLIGSLLAADEKSGAALLVKGFAIWGTNVITFGLLYWELDGGGPESRRSDLTALRDFQFPQMENPQLALPGWQPHLVDYIYVSFTNSIAFSPTDAMPLSHRAKLLMICESAISGLAVLLVAARAVNILH